MTHRFIAPVARIGVASKDGRVLGRPADPVLRAGGPVPVMMHFPVTPWTDCGRITGAGVLDDLLILSGVIDNPATAELLDEGTFFLSIGVLADEVTDPEVDELAGPAGPTVFESWAVQYALAADASGKPWDLPDTLVWEAS